MFSVKPFSKGLRFPKAVPLVAARRRRNLLRLESAGKVLGKPSPGKTPPLCGGDGGEAVRGERGRQPLKREAQTSPQLWYNTCIVSLLTFVGIETMLVFFV